MVMIHPNFYSDFFEMKIEQMGIKYTETQDHKDMHMELTSMQIFDLTNHPYTDLTSHPD